MKVWSSCQLCSILALLGLYYRPPNSGSSLEDLESVLSELDLLVYKRCILLGDFNIDQNEPLTQELMVIKDRTRSTDSSSTLIDHAYTSSTALITDFSVLSPQTIAVFSSGYLQLSHDISFRKEESGSTLGRILRTSMRYWRMVCWMALDLRWML